MKPGITVVTPTVPPRRQMLMRAMASVDDQRLPAAAHVVVVDHDASGEAATRNRGLFAVDTEWTAFLDDDDFFYPDHLRALFHTALDTDADLVYPWFDVDGGADPLGREGMAFDADELRRNNYIPVTYLVRTAIAHMVGGFPDADRDAVYPSPTACVDWAMLLRLLDFGARFVHLPERTWRWVHHGGNLSGRTWR